MSLRIAVVEFSPSGGLFQFALQMAEGLVTHGHTVDLVTGHNPELQARNDGVQISAILPTWDPGDKQVHSPAYRKARRAVRALFYIDAWRRVARHLRRSRPDVVQWGEWRFTLDGLAVWGLSRRRQRSRPVQAVVAHTPVPLVETSSTGDLRKSGRFLTWAFSRAYSNMDVVFVLGENSARQLRAAWPARRVQSIPHGDEGIFATRDVPAADETGPTALFFGNWNRYKGIDLLLDAWEPIPPRVEGAELVVAGTVGRDVDYEGIVERAAGLPGVRLQPGYVAVDAVAGLFGAARVVVLPYRAGNQSGVLHLAQTFARPAVATDVGDLPAAIEDGVTGFVTPAGDAAALSAAITELLEHPERAAEMGGAALARCKAEASWPEVARQVGDVYRELSTER